MDEETEIEMHKPLTQAAREAVLREVPLIEAALLRIKAALDLEQHECGTCHLVLRRSYRDVQLADTLKGARGKLRRWEEEAGGRKKM